MLMTMQRFGATAGAHVRRAIAAADAFLDSIDQPISDQDWQRLDVAMLTLGAVFLALNFGLIAFSVLA
ncbi:MAG: hypothetical protein JWL91_336 [Sphingomonas bacterium]|nr:hypothetical protein [Sphingomonas bacterium]MDB5688460.1 hypothetical protein [Sphingomonas bacterium]